MENSAAVSKPQITQLGQKDPFIQFIIFGFTMKLL